MKNPVQRALPHPPIELLHGASLFLDLDGTLVEIAPRPDAIRVDDELHELLGRLSHALEGRVVIVSGRAGSELRRLLANPELVIAGSHGAETRFPDGRTESPAVVLPDQPAIARLRELEDRFPGVLLEEKPFGLALHFREAPWAEADCRRLAAEIAAESGYALQPGKMVIELKYHPASKGDAVRSLMASAPLRGSRPVFVGDDLTDEAGFAAASELGGAGILVGPPRPTHAGYRLPAVEDALRWLGDAARHAR